MRRLIQKLLPGAEPVVRRSRSFIPVSTPCIGAAELDEVTRSLRQGWISSLGPAVSRFEERFSAYCGSRYGVACSSGTAALHLALAGLAIKPGDEVIIPSFTMAATAFAVLYQGAVPVLVDSEPETGNIDARLVKKAVTRKTRAVICVHIYGHPCDMGPVLALCRGRGIPVIEDAAESHGAEYNGKRCGSLADAACFSFYGNKIVTTGEGGMVVTGDCKLKERCERLRDMAFSSERHFWHKELGFNYRMSSLQAAVGLAQTARLDRLVAAKRRLARRYTRLLSGCPGIALPVERPYAKSVYWMYGIRVGRESKAGRDALRKVLAGKGIETRSYFIPMHLQPFMSPMRRSGRFPVAEELCRTGMYIPSGAGLPYETIEFVARQIREACA